MIGFSFVLLAAISPAQIPAAVIFIYALVIIAAILYWAASTNRLGKWILLLKRGRGATDITSSDIIPQNEIIPMFFDYDNKQYPLLSIEKTKEYDKELGDVLYRIAYADNNQIKYVDVPETRLEIPITVENLSGESLTVRHRGDVAVSRAEATNELLREKINQLKAEILALKDKLKEQGFSDEYRSARDKQREGAVHSSRTFGGFGARYPTDIGSTGEETGEE